MRPASPVRGFARRMRQVAIDGVPVGIHEHGGGVVEQAAGPPDARAAQLAVAEPDERDRKITQRAADRNADDEGQRHAGYDRWIQLEQSDSEIARAEAEYAAARQELMVQVAERYFNVLDAQDNLEFAEAEKSAIGRQLEQATQRFEVGLIAITDVKAAQARYDLSVSQEIRALSLLVEAKDALREIAGEYYDELALLKPDLELVRPNPDSTDAWIEQAKRQNLSVLAAQAGAEPARQEIRRQRPGHYPTLDLNASTVAETSLTKNWNKVHWHAFGHSQEQLNFLWQRVLAEDDLELKMMKLGQFLHFLQERVGEAHVNALGRRAAHAEARALFLQGG